LRGAIWAVAAALALTPFPAFAAEAPSAPAEAKPADWAERVSHGLVLARLAQPEELVVSSALKQLDEGLVKALQAAPQMQQIEAKYPGFIQRYYTAARPELQKALGARLPQLWQGMAEAYAGEMTVAEIDRQASFLRGPLGQKMQRLATDNFDASGLLQSSVKAGLDKNQTPGAGQDELAEASGGAMLYSLSQLTDAERTEFVEYMSSPTGLAAQRAGKGVMAAIVAWMNAEDPEAETKMSEIATRVLTEMQKEPQK
jgi:hypothetical protein